MLCNAFLFKINYYTYNILVLNYSNFDEAWGKCNNYVEERTCDERLIRTIYFTKLKQKKGLSITAGLRGNQ